MLKLLDRWYARLTGRYIRWSICHSSGESFGAGRVEIFYPDLNTYVSAIKQLHTMMGNGWKVERQVPVSLADVVWADGVIPTLSE